MTPRLQQAIKLLQYNSVEMRDHIQEQLLENPTLEEVPDSTVSGLQEGEARLHEQLQRSQDDVVDQRNGDEGSSIDWEQYMKSMAEGPRAAKSLGGTIHDDLPPIETNLTYGESLADHLLFQLQMDENDDEVRAAAEHIIHNLDHRGYLVACDPNAEGRTKRVGVPLTDEEIAEAVGVSLEVVEDALYVVQHLDPIGCGARGLIECLCVQARHLHPADKNFELILTDHLGDLERRRYAVIGRALEIDEEDVIEYHRMIQDFEPHPGRSFSLEEPRYITPDVYVRKYDGEWQVFLNEDGMPDLRISGYYQKIFQTASADDKEFLLDKLKSAEFLIKSINRRRKTIIEVMRNILIFQRDFFEDGASALRPLTLQQVAEQVYTGKELPGEGPNGVHMSTVSRVTTNKYVHTPHGILELKYFFKTGIPQNSGESQSNEAIKARIKALVGDENPKRPLSDQAIADALKTDGVKVARRTVAKYREAMGILPSSQRKNVF